MTSNAINSEAKQSIKPNLLCIDDEKRILRSLKALFSSTHNVYATTSPSEFVHLLEEHHMHVILCDQRMPKQTGTELLSFAKGISPNSIRILLTGYADSSAVINSVNDGEVFRYLKKPWDVDEIRQLIKQATNIALTLENHGAEFIGNGEGGLVELIGEDVDADVDEMPISSTTNNKPAVLYVNEDNVSSLLFLQTYESRYDIACVKDKAEFEQAILHQEFAVAVVNMEFEQRNISPLMDRLKQVQPFVTLVLESHFSDSDQLIQLINSQQIFHCFSAPADSESVKTALENAVKAFENVKSNPIAQLQHLLKVLDKSDVEDAEQLKARITELGAIALM